MMMMKKKRKKLQHDKCKDKPKLGPGNIPSLCLDNIFEALFVFVAGPTMKLQHLRLLQGLERTKLNLESDLGPLDLNLLDLEVKMEPNSNDFPTAF